jgi:hypothetical protein
MKWDDDTGMAVLAQSIGCDDQQLLHQSLQYDG